MPEPALYAAHRRGALLKGAGFAFNARFVVFAVRSVLAVVVASDGGLDRHLGSCRTLVAFGLAELGLMLTNGAVLTKG